MLKRLTAIVLLIALISTNCSRFFACAGFELNQKYIAENLCVNKARPWLHCNGKCYFMKKIKQAEENEKKQETKDNLSRLEISIFKEPFTVAFIAPVILENNGNSFPRYNFQYSNRYIETIFRPPKLAA
ncbi:MAG: hypothetical protein JWR67_1989 [Mucilaginibacter sp.]|nr:hypothetical protein [Mucilaginibacter sp.]